MPIRKDAQGRWHAEACVQRRRLHRRLPPGATAGDAKHVEAELIRALHAQGTQRHPSIPGDPLLTVLMADYADRHVLTLRSPATARYHALRIGRWLDGRRASEARAVASAIVEDMTGHYAAATINRSLGALKKALRIAWQRGRTIANYGELIEMLPERNARTTWLTLDQVRTIADHASEATRAAIWISVLTGCRRGEALAITPAMISRDAISLPAGATKTERARSVPIIAPLRPWLKHVPLLINFEGLKSGFRRAREAAGMPHVQFRDLRRSCGTLLIQQGVPLHVVSRILGHSSTAITERVYAHLASEQVHAGLDKLTALHRDLHRGRKKKAA
jgi:integrase